MFQSILVIYRIIFTDVMLTTYEFKIAYSNWQARSKPATLLNAEPYQRDNRNQRRVKFKNNLVF